MNDEPQFNYTYHHKNKTFVYYPLDPLEYNLVKRAPYHPINVRQVFEEHTRLVVDDKLEEVKYEDYFYEPLIPNIVVSKIYKATSEINHEDKSTFPTLVNYNGRYLRTLDGAYDAFIFIHLGLDVLLRVFEMGPQYKAMIIALLEQTTHINVEDRYHKAMETGESLVLNTSDDELSKDTGPDYSKIAQSVNEAGGDGSAAVEATMDLQRTMERDKRNPKSHYNWHNDKEFNEAVGTMRPK